MAVPLPYRVRSRVTVEVAVLGKLLALVYDILPSTTAVFSYAIGSRKLSQLTSSFVFVFCWCSNSSKFVTNNSNKTRCVIYSRQQSLQWHKQNYNRLNQDGTLFFPYPGWMRLVFTCVCGREVASIVILVPEHFGGR